MESLLCGTNTIRSTVSAVAKSEDESDEEQGGGSDDEDDEEQGDGSDDEEEEYNEKKEAAIGVFKLALTFLVFYLKFIELKKKLVVTDEFATELHNMTDADIAAVLEKHKVGVHTVSRALLQVVDRGLRVWQLHCFHDWQGDAPRPCRVEAHCSFAWPRSRREPLR